MKLKIALLPGDGIGPEIVGEAVNQAIEAGVVTEDLAAAGAKACSTTEVGDFVAGHIA